MKRPGRGLLRLLIVVAALVALVWTIVALDPRKVWQVARGANAFWLALSAVPIFARFLIWGVKWRRMLARHEPVPFGLSTRIIAAGSFVNLTTPTAKLAGGVVRAALLNKCRGWRLSLAYGWALADQVTNLLGQTLLFAVGALAFAAHPASGALAPVFVGLGVVTLGGLALTVILREPTWNWVQRPALAHRISRFVPARFVGKEGVTRDRLQQIFGPLLHEGASWRAFIPDLLLGALAFSTLPIANAMVLRSLGVETPLVVITVVVVLGYLAGNLLGAWGGIGVTEAALTTLGVHFGVPAEQAAAGALLHRAIFYMVVLSVGGWGLWIETRAATV